ncbi:DUF6575 domain-containing protein [Archangium lansingense]|uniref:DUF6575 domain-containing protein n=1 Tax=Archangium lansingense TaxID=2995310 RepID=A0ABT4AP32_9BACT|nr:DUF6575 domain-containing protein [Archangium lansinium]MCY1083425.1 hypothetical protein [Archangium lansinium]
MNLLPSDTALGTLYLVETYEFYDRPLLFSCRNGAEQFFLVLLIEEASALDRWLLVPVSRARLLDVRAGEEDLASAFSWSESGRVWVLTDFRGQHPSELRNISNEEIDAAWLPEKGERLTCREHFPVPEVSRPKQRAAASGRDALDLKLFFPDLSSSGRAPMDSVGHIFSDFQHSIDALAIPAMQKGDATWKQQKKVRSSETALLIEGTFYGSFGVQITAASHGDLFGHSALSIALENLFTLVDAKADEDRLREILKPIGARAAQRYSRFLSTVAHDGVSFAVEWAAPVTKSYRTARLNSEEARAAAAFILRSELKESRQEVVVATLVGLNRRTRVFELWVEEDKRSIVGKISLQALAVASGATISERYVATVVESLEAQELLEEERRLYELIDLKPLASQEHK